MENNRFEPFYILKEIQSLDRYIDSHLLVIEDQNKRLTKLNELKTSRYEDLKEHEQELSQLEKSIASKEVLNTKLSRDWSQAIEAEKQVKTSEELMRGQKQKETLQKDKDLLEQELFKLLEQMDELQQIIQTDKDFLQGIEKTLIEIGSEANAQIKLEQSKINDYEMRQKLLLDDLPTPFKDRFLTVRTKLKGKRPITIAKGNLCAECLFVLPRQILSDLDRGVSLVGCPQCLRLLLPSTASSSKS